MLTLAVQAWAIETPEQAPAGDVTPPESILPTFRPSLSLITSKALSPGEFARNFSYDGANPLFGLGNMTMRYSQGLALFGEQAGASSAAWQLGFSVAPKQHGFSGSISYSQTPQHVGSAAGPFAAGEMGLRRMDMKVGWGEGARSFSIGRDRAELLDGGAGLGRDTLSASFDGFSYSRERVAFDSAMNFDGGNVGLMLGATGYGLAARQLGASAGGYTNLAGLNGLVERYEKIGYERGKLAFGQWDRTLEQNGEKLHDFGQSLKYGRVALSRTAKSMSAGFAPLAQVGYINFGGLRNGRLDELAANYTGNNWSAAWQQSLLSVGEGDGRSISRTSVYRLSATPLTGLALNASHTTTASGTAAAFAATDQLGVTRSSAQHFDAAYQLKNHQFAGRLDLGHTSAGATRVKTQSWELAYAQGPRTKVTLAEQRGDTMVTDAEGKVSHAPTWAQQLTINTALGLTYSRRKQSAGEASGRYEAVIVERSPFKNANLKATYERWRNTSSPGYVVANRGGLLDAPIPHAVGWTVAGSWKPGKLTVDAQWRQLAWRQDAEARGFAAGNHNVSEYTVGLTHQLSGNFNVHGEWNLVQTGSDRDRERRELTVQYQPSANPLIPMAEAGVRQVLVGKKSTFAPFARLKLQPYQGLSFEAAMAQAAIDEAKMRDALTFSKQQKAALRFSASQALGKDGKITASYGTQPRVSAKPVDAWESGPLARTISVDVSSPTNLLVPGLQLTGGWQRQSEPEGGVTGLSELNNYRAGLAWKNGGHDLTINYQLSATGLVGGDRDNSRLDLSYSADLGEAGKLSITGYWNTDSALDNKNKRDIPEAWRVGLLYNAGF